MVRKIRHRSRHHKHQSAAEVFAEEPPLKKVRPGDEDSSTKYFVPEPVEEKTVDKDVTKFLLEESMTKTAEKEEGEQERPEKLPRNVFEEPERGRRDMTNWYVIATAAIILIVLMIYFTNLDLTRPRNETAGQTGAEETGWPESSNASAPVVAPSPNATTALKDFTLNITGLRTVGDFRQLDNNLGNLVNECNRSDRCKAALKGYRKVGLRTQSKSYTFTINRDGRIVNLRHQLESGTNFVMDASEEDLVALYNALAINDEETVLLKLQRILPPEVMLQAMQGMMAG